MNKITKFCTKDEISQALNDKDIPPSISAVNKIFEKAANYFPEYTDADWQTLYSIIDASELSDEVSSIEDLTNYDEYIAEFTLEGDYCVRHSVVDRPDATDIAGSLEDTLHRIIERVPENRREDMIYQILGATREESEISVDLGYYLPNILSWKIIVPEKKYDWKIIDSELSIYSFNGTQEEADKLMKQIIVQRGKEAGGIIELSDDSKNTELCAIFANNDCYSIRCIREQDVINASVIENI